MRLSEDPKRGVEQQITLHAVMQLAWKRLCEAHGHKAAKPPVVFDIDDTLILPHSERIIRPAKALFDRCMAQGYPVYIVTARPDCPGNEDATIAMLKRKRLWKGVKELYLMPEGDKSVWAYKYKRRLDIAKLCGAPVAMTVGDQQWDVLPGWCGNRVSSEIQDGGVIRHPKAPDTLGVLLPPVKTEPQE